MGAANRPEAASHGRFPVCGLGSVCIGRRGTSGGIRAAAGSTNTRTTGAKCVSDNASAVLTVRGTRPSAKRSFATGRVPCRGTKRTNQPRMTSVIGIDGAMGGYWPGMASVTTQSLTLSVGIS